MSESKILQPVAEMLLAIERKSPPLWPLPIINDLVAQSNGKAMDWACAFVESQLTRFGSLETASVRRVWLSDLRKRTAQSFFEDTGRISRQVWYHGGTRDEAQTAIARLYEALSHLSTEHYEAYCKAVSIAVMVVASDSGGHPLPPAIAKMIDLYNNMAG